MLAIKSQATANDKTCENSSQHAAVNAGFATGTKQERGSKCPTACKNPQAMKTTAWYKCLPVQCACVHGTKHRFRGPVGIWQVRHCLELCQIREANLGPAKDTCKGKRKLQLVAGVAFRLVPGLTGEGCVVGIAVETRLSLLLWPAS